MNLLEKHPLKSVGRPLDTSEEAFGELRDSSYLLGDGEATRARMEEDGYLFLRGFFRREDVLAARRIIVERLAEEGFLQAGADPMEAIVPEEESEVAVSQRDTDVPLADKNRNNTHVHKNRNFRPDLTTGNEPLHRLLYRGAMMEFYREFFGEPVRHYDFTWLRTIERGNGTRPHCDMVYMGRGEREKLLTAWVPLGDAPLSLGGLMVLEGSNHQHELLRPYLERDVDSYCKNGRHAPEIEAGAKAWEWDGSLSKDPASLRRKLGGRWLTTDYEAGDLLTFTMYTVHAGLDNQTNRIRLSSDSRYQPASRPADERWVGETPIAHGQAGKRGRIC
jgi:hypothetical protein